MKIARKHYKRLVKANYLDLYYKNIYKNYSYFYYQLDDYFNNTNIMDFNFIFCNFIFL